MSDDSRDFILSGEFSEQTGPVVSDLCLLRNGQAKHYKELCDDDTKEFMMRAMSGDHVFNSHTAEPELVQFRPCEITMNRVKWRYSPSQPRDMLMAFVCSFQICDVFARAYTRTVCFAFLTPDSQKLFTILPWVAHELTSIARLLFDVTRRIHELEAFEAYLSLQHCMQHRDRLTQLSERHRLQLPGEFEDTKARLRQLRPLPEGLAAAAGTSETEAELAARHVQSVVDSLACEYQLQTSDEMAVTIAHRLTTQKGSATLRSIPEIYNRYECHFGDYRDVVHRIERAIGLLSLPADILIDQLSETMQTLPTLMSRGFSSIVSFKPPSHFRLRIGGFVAADPHVDRWQEVAEGVGGSMPRVEHLTPFEAEDLYDRVLPFGEHTIVNIAFHALRGAPIVVCGSNVPRVLEAMQIASMFVPGLAQSRRHYQVGFVPFNDTARVTADDVIQNAVIGCPPRAILDGNGVPYLGNVVVWAIGTRRETAGKQTSEAIESTLYGSCYSALEGRGGLLEDLFSLIRVGPVAAQQPMSNYLKLTLSRLFVELSTMASLVLYSIKEGGERAFVLSDAVVHEVLVNQFGYVNVRHDDCVMVCSIARRILLLTHEEGGRAAAAN